jgi:hypothetical protein
MLPNPVRPNDTLADIPFIKGFIMRMPSGSAQAVQDFYDRMQRNQALYTAMQKQIELGHKEAAKHIQEVGGPEMMITGAPGVLKGISDTLNVQAKFVRDMYDYPNFTGAQKRQAIDRMYWQMIAAAKGGIHMMDEAKEKGEAAQERSQQRRAMQAAQTAPPPGMTVPLSQ